MMLRSLGVLRSPVFAMNGAAASRYVKTGLSSQYRAYSSLSTNPEGNSPIDIEDLKSFRQFVANKDNVSVIDFHATWCGPCKMLEPIFETLAQRVPEVQFGRVDVDAAQDIAQEYGITAMPTCLFFIDGQKVDTIIGANPPKLVELIQKHSGADLQGR